MCILIIVVHVSAAPFVCGFFAPPLFLFLFLFFSFISFITSPPIFYCSHQRQVFFFKFCFALYRERRSKTPRTQMLPTVRPIALISCNVLCMTEITSIFFIPACCLPSSSYWALPPYREYVIFKVILQPRVRSQSAQPLTTHQNSRIVFKWSGTNDINLTLLAWRWCQSDVMMLLSIICVPRVWVCVYVFVTLVDFLFVPFIWC